MKETQCTDLGEERKKEREREREEKRREEEEMMEGETNFSSEIEDLARVNNNKS